CSVSDLRQSRRLGIVNRSERVNLGAARSGFRRRTVPTDPGVGLPSLALGDMQPYGRFAAEMHADGAHNNGRIFFNSGLNEKQIQQIQKAAEKLSSTNRAE